MPNYPDLTKDFIVRNADLAWQDMLYGLDHGYIDERTVRDLAIEKVRADSSLESCEMRLSVLNDSDLYRVREILTQAISTHTIEQEDRPKRKWCFLSLQWLFEHKDQVADPLGAVDEIYADFDYPEEVAPFVSYESAYPRAAHEPTGKDLLLSRWAGYLQKMRSELRSQGQA